MAGQRGSSASWTWVASLIVALSLLTVAATDAHAARTVVEVTTTTDEFGTGSACSLREAVQSANISGPFGGCSRRPQTGPPSAEEHPDATEIALKGGATYRLTRAGTDNTNAAGDIDILQPIQMLPVIANPKLVPPPATIDPGGDDRALDFHIPSSLNSNVKDAQLSSLVIRGGSAPGGGGIRVGRGQVFFQFGAIVDNEATGSPDAAGGGVLVERNAASNPFTEFLSMGLNNVTVSGNRANGSGGGVAALGGTAAGFVTGMSTFSENIARVDGSGPLGGGGIGLETNTQGGWANVIISGNSDGGGSAPDCTGSFLPGNDSWVGANVIGDISGCGYTAHPGDMLNTDPLLAPLGDNGNATPTHALLPTSPAIDAGLSGPAGMCIIGLDARGARRLGREDPLCDSGAYERAFCAAAEITTVSAIPVTAVGGPGPDGMFAPGAGVEFRGGGGPDGLCGEGRGSDMLIGGAGADAAFGGQGDDTIKGGSGADELEGEVGDDVVRGQGGGDVLTGGRGDDKLIGGGGGDKLSAAAGADKLNGGSGNDRLVGGSGKNVLNCGSGRKDVVRADKNDKVRRNCEKKRKLR